jgi:hypothetical protein
LTHNSRNGKSSANKIRRLLSSTENSNQTNSDQAATDQVVYKRPERLITKLKVANIDDKSGKQLVLARQPKNPDGKMKSFSREIGTRPPGCLTSTSSIKITKNNSADDLLSLNEAAAMSLLSQVPHLENVKSSPALTSLVNIKNKSDESRIEDYVHDLDSLSINEPKTPKFFTQYSTPSRSEAN